MDRNKVQPHCMVCRKPFKRNDQVYTDTLATQIQHTKCFIYKPEFIKDTGTYEEIVNKYPNYKNFTFLLINNALKRVKRLWYNKINLVQDALDMKFHKYNNTVFIINGTLILKSIQNVLLIVQKNMTKRFKVF